MSEIRYRCSSFGVHSVFTVCCPCLVLWIVQYQTLKGGLCGLISVLFRAVSSVCLKSSLNKFWVFQSFWEALLLTSVNKHTTSINLKLSSEMYIFFVKHQFCVLSSWSIKFEISKPICLHLNWGSHILTSSIIIILVASALHIEIFVISSGTKLHFSYRILSSSSIFCPRKHLLHTAYPWVTQDLLNLLDISFRSIQVHVQVLVRPWNIRGYHSPMNQFLHDGIQTTLLTKSPAHDGWQSLVAYALKGKSPNSLVVTYCPMWSLSCPRGAQDVDLTVSLCSIRPNRPHGILSPLVVLHRSQCISYFWHNAKFPHTFSSIRVEWIPWQWGPAK